MVSTAIAPDNPERVVARERGQRELHRGDLLAEVSRLKPCVAVCGTHGKTTTTAMAAHALVESGQRPSYVIGGELRSSGVNATWADGEWLVVEADESDRSFLKLTPEVAVVTNVELDHHSTYRSTRDLENAFERFLRASHRTSIRWREVPIDVPAITYGIGGGDLGPHGAQFVPPQQSRIEPAIADLVAFIRRDDLPVLVHGAVAHAQFETVHPFPDGNGRTGRALLHAMLRNKRLTRNVTVPVSAGLLTNTSAYFDALTAYRLGDPAPMVIRLADAAFAAVVNGRRLVDELRTIRGGWNERVTARRDSSTWRVADFLMRHPVVDAQLLTAELNIPPNNVYRYLEPLERAGVLIEFTDRRRNRAWRSAEILAALDAFAARAGKRRLSG